MKKQYKRGLLLGKFMPLHKGHQHLISSGYDKCDHLTVLACSLSKEPIPGYLRARWVKEYCNKLDTSISVVDMRENLPQLPEEHEKFWEIWCDVINRSAPNGLDVIFSSEDYGFELAKRLGIKHELIDKERKTVPISGTAIRNNPFDNWQFIPNHVKPYFLHRIYFLGPESTGKSTISKLLSEEEEFETNWVPEYGRILYEKNVGELSLMDFHEIVIKQREIEQQLAERCSKQFMFCDTEVITTKIFSKLYYPKESVKLNHFFNYHIKKQLDNNCHFFIMHPDGTKSVQDGTRNYIKDKERLKHFTKIISELKNWNVSYTILTGEYNDRIQTVKNYLKNIVQ